jgi:hypothetical protein
MLKNSGVPAMLKTFKSQSTINPTAVRRRPSFIEERIHDALSKFEKLLLGSWLGKRFHWWKQKKAWAF